MENRLAPNRLFFVVVAGLSLVGALLGLGLSSLPKLVPYKLLNITGILYGLLGIVVLGELVVRSDKLKTFMVSYVAGAVLWSSLVVPLGMLLGAAIAYSMGQPSAPATARWSVSFVVYSMLPLAAIDATVFKPSQRPIFDLDGRHQVLGLALVLGGGALQLAAAIYDLLV